MALIVRARLQANTARPSPLLASTSGRFCCATLLPRAQPQPRIVPHGIPVTGPGSAPQQNSGDSLAPTGQISSELMESMRQKIAEALETSVVKVEDVYGDARHVSIDVVSRQFEGQSAMKRQRMVYRAIWQELTEAVHAVDAMVTKTPEEAGLAPDSVGPPPKAQTSNRGSGAADD